MGRLRTANVCRKLPRRALDQRDITQIEAGEIPITTFCSEAFHVSPSRLPVCQKKNALGRAHGFQDETQGTLFFDVARIIDEKRPKAFLLENVKNLQSHDKGRTFDVIQRTLRKSWATRFTAR